jgi:hypothetical protein
VAGDTIVLPTIPGSRRRRRDHHRARASMGGCRGMKHKRPDGTQQRPDFVILDDPQTDESASTPLQVNKRLDIIRKSILKLGGHDRKIACRDERDGDPPGDLVEQLFDPKKFPAWQGERIKMVSVGGRRTRRSGWATTPAAQHVRPEQLGDQQRAHRAATEFYRRNREKMDAGCEVSWEHCFDRDTELSAIQHAYNMPDRRRRGGLRQRVPERAAAPGRGPARGALTADADRGQASTGWSAATCRRRRRGWWRSSTCRRTSSTGRSRGRRRLHRRVVDYGTFPEQKGRKYFALREVRSDAGEGHRGKSLEEDLYAGLDALVGAPDGAGVGAEDGAVLKPERILIDANWGESTDVVYRFCRQSPHAAVLMPSHGRYVGATSRPLNDCKRKPGDRVGAQLAHPRHLGGTRYVLIDANAWKTFMFSRLRVGHGRRAGAGRCSATPRITSCSPTT